MLIYLYFLLLMYGFNLLEHIMKYSIPKYIHLIKQDS